MYQPWYDDQTKLKPIQVCRIGHVLHDNSGDVHQHDQLEQWHKWASHPQQPESCHADDMPYQDEGIYLEFITWFFGHANDISFLATQVALQFTHVSRSIVVSD